jgi:hypothetical protein
LNNSDSSEIDKNIEKYKEAYDVVIINDGSMEFVNDILGKIL